MGLYPSTFRRIDPLFKFVPCRKENDIYTADVSDNPFFFKECIALKIILLDHNDDPDQIIASIKDIHLIYGVDGREVSLDCEPIRFKPMNWDQPDQYLYVCNIPRPEVLSIDPRNPAMSVQKIKLGFSSVYTFGAEFYIETYRIYDDK